MKLESVELPLEIKGVVEGCSGHTVMPTWVSEDGVVQLYHDDCARVLPFVSSQSALITDPPYGIGVTHMTGGLRGKKGLFKSDPAWDDEPINSSFLNWVVSCFSESVIWGLNFFDLPPTKCVLAWDKKLPSAFSFAKIELAWTSLSQQSDIFSFCASQVGRVDTVGKVHPAQKPVGLMEWCVSKTKSDLIVDPYMGSGSTGVAAVNLCRRFIGVEREQKYFDIAVDRIRGALARKQGTGLSGLV